MRSSGRKVCVALLNEDALVARLRELIAASPGNRRLLNAIGDDVAIWQPSRSHRSVVTTDALIEGVHFRRVSMSLHDIGWRAMASNLSDAAAAGAKPLLATIALGVPPDLDADGMAELYRGMLAPANSNGCAIAGGDLTRAPELLLSITVIAEVRATHFKGRGGARPGDVAAVTGPLGASRAGLHAADNPTMLRGEELTAALAAHRTPQPRVAQGRWLAASTAVHAMMDVSDGLSTDLARMCARSGCGALIDEVPIASCADAAASALGEDAQAFALAGGEDFELLVAVAPRAFEHLRERYRKRFGTPLYAIGRFREGSALCRQEGATEQPLTPAGWDHFS